ncbi:hypothetical protein [Raoultella ornithinolytica]|uniref:hypothetical protein n=1 Tax=Raoultella ornithinolytica TaxID=54291 RepID=UPI001F3B0DE5|nr:hypothetical protein [Raoultella ornithinolytica]
MNIETVNELIQSLESAGELSIREQKFLKLAKAYQQLAAENVALKSFGDKLNGMHNALNGEGTGIQGRAEVACQQVALEAAMEEFDAIETPATDRIVAGIKADGRVEGAHFVANRMLAAWDAGFIEDTAKNAADIARMILASTEFMAGAPEGDFDRSFADGILEDIAQQLREGADK